MAYIINLKKFHDDRGSLIAIEDRQIPFKIKRVYNIVNPSGVRGRHRHRKTVQAMICVSGSCVVYNNDGTKEEEFFLDSPTKCLILEAKDWHLMKEFKGNCVIEVMASEYYDANDYISEPYEFI